MPALIGLGAVGVVLVGGVAVYLFWREQRLRTRERQQRRRRRIAYQLTWNWLMRPRVARLTDQRKNRN